MDISYEFIGKVSVVALILLAVLIFIGLVLTYVVFTRRRIFFPKLILFVIDSLYIPSKRIVSFFNGNEMMIDSVGVEIRNMLLKEKFSEVPYEKRLIILPQCLRSIDCPTKLSSVEGMKCLKCKKCKIWRIVKKAEELGYIGCFIIPGGGFIKRIIRKFKPQGILGIACPYELNLAMMEFSGFIAGYGVYLSKTGCVETDVDLEAVFEAIEMRKKG